MLSLFLLLSACSRSHSEPDDGPGDLGCPMPDLATPPPKCAAAKGLAGDNLLCVDFKDVSALSGLGGWDFTSIGGGCWEVMNGKLQVASFSTFASTCGFKLPALAAADYQKYSAFTLSVVQTVSLDESASQKGQVMQGADDALNRLLTQWTGKQARQQSVITVNKADIPGAALQPLFKLSATSTAGGIYKGWQIESIAIQGVQ